jgi:hypothetical protein
MPTIVHFVGGEKPITVADDYAFVGSAFKGREEAQFKRMPGDNSVTIYKAGVAYIEMMMTEDDQMRAADLAAS